MREATVATSILIDLAAQLEARGVAPRAWCVRAGCDPARLDDPNERLGGETVRRLWHAAVEMTGDPLLGLHVAEAHRTGAISILGYVVLNCRTARDAVERLSRFAALMNDGLHVRVANEGDGEAILFEPIAGLRNFLVDDGRQVMETLAAGVVVTLRRLLARPVEPRAVHFRHAPGGPLAEYHRVFGPVVRFGAPLDGLVLDRATLAAPIPTADPALLAMFESHAQARLDALDGAGPVTRRALAAVTRRLTGTLPDIAEIGRDLAMSGRSLQRALQHEGTSFRALLDAAREERARALLARPGTTAAEVALALGFSEASAFTRAFRRWTGTTPAAWAARASH